MVTPQTDEMTWQDLAGEPESPPVETEPTPAKRYTLKSAADALQPQPPIEWIVDGLFSAGSLSLIVGEGGSKKTWCCLDMGASVATGAAWLDRPTSQGAVLIVDEESGNRRLSERLGKVLRGHAADASTPLYYVSLAQFDFSHPDDVNELNALILQTSARLVIIDALADVMPGRDENAVKDVQPLFLALRRVAEVSGAAIVIIHHSNKGGDYRGSTAIKGAVDLMLMVASDPESPNIDIKTIKARDTEPAHFAAVANFAPDTFNLSPSLAKDTVTLSNSQDFVIGYLATHPNATIDDIKANAEPTCSPKTAENALRSLAHERMGYIKRTDTGGAGGRGLKAAYDLTEKGREYAQNRL